jgi:hypothetical protein
VSALALQTGYSPDSVLPPQASRQSTKIAKRGGAVALIAAAVSTAIPDLTLSKVAAVGFGVYAAYAGYTYSIGRCVDFNVTWYGGVYPGSYRDWRCR